MRNISDLDNAPEIEEEEDSSVLLSIGDLMSGLLMLFALLFITVQIQLSEKAKMLDEKILQVEKLRQELQQYQKAFEGLPQIIVNALEGKVGDKDIFTVDPGTGDVSIRDRILFDNNSSVLKPEGKKFLQAFIPIYTQVLFANKQFEKQISRVVIEGHTSSAGSDSKNLELSLRRALAVSNYMFSNEVNFPKKAELQQKVLVSGRGELDANPTQNAAGDRKVVFRFQFRRENLNVDVNRQLPSPESKSPNSEFHRWYPPRDLSVESIPNRKSKILSSPEFIRGVNLKSKI
ncbi:OmpA family protein [Microcoleus sp. PH2017_35_SFW_U_B]|uniref:OmpA family protein n=1 Tax=Microcoleus sp. PH2017_35_SFW_U_B TaxID=2798845 RepID=UPI001E11B5A5|nr:OmpA family protein [Microcoleus sp. PH2017_35_SFW_U_B]MCC3510379.1 OmpA family protein [Microcoleus sp. PH2017_17_BER_D_A]MCC3555102.1 OmpA family protein [Microcoleus sp. PH2017_35_SFW_U_B]